MHYEEKELTKPTVNHKKKNNNRIRTTEESINEVHCCHRGLKPSHQPLWPRHRREPVENIRGKRSKLNSKRRDEYRSWRRSLFTKKLEDEATNVMLEGK